MSETGKVIEEVEPRVRDRRQPARRVVFGVMALFLLLASAFAIGSVFADPGGTAALVVVVAWVVPVVALTAYTLLRPARAEQVLIVASAVVAAFVLLQALTGVVPTDDAGPVGTLAALALSVPLAFLGLHRAGMAGRLLLGVGAALLLSGFLGAPAGSATALAAPLLLFGLLFLVTAEPQGGSHRGPAPTVS